MHAFDALAYLGGTEDGPWDEAVDRDGTVRDGYGAVLDALTRSDAGAVADRVGADVAERGVRFGDGGAPFRVDPVPRIVDAATWDGLQRGLIQRARALDAFVADVHGRRDVVADGVVPASLVAASPFVEPDLVALDAPPRTWIPVAGLDVVRDATGALRVLEDNTRTPSGLAYMLASRAAVGGALGVPDDVAGLADAVGPALLRALRATVPAGADDGAAVLLSDGAGNTARWEHARLADLMGVPLVGPDGLRQRGDRLCLRDGGQPVAAVYRRTDETDLRAADGSLNPLAALLLPAIRAGNVGVMNAYGTGVADDKAVYPHVPDLIRYYCGEEPALRDVPVHDLRDAATREAVLDRAGELVLKPRGGLGGQGVVIGPLADPDELRRTVDAVRADPDAWIAQDTVVLSTHPTVVGGRLRPRHVDLRPFVLADGAGGFAVLPGALTRVALDEGQAIVNSSRGGGSKDTWVIR